MILSIQAHSAEASFIINVKPPRIALATALAVMIGVSVPGVAFGRAVILFFLVLPVAFAIACAFQHSHSHSHNYRHCTWTRCIVANIDTSEVGPELVA